MEYEKSLASNDDEGEVSESDDSEE